MQQDRHNKCQYLKDRFLFRNALGVEVTHQKLFRNMAHQDTAHKDMNDAGTKDIDHIFRQGKTDRCNDHEGNDIKPGSLVDVFPDIFTGKEELCHLFTKRIDDIAYECTIQQRTVCGNTGHIPWDPEQRTKQHDQSTDRNALKEQFYTVFLIFFITFAVVHHKEEHQ